MIKHAAAAAAKSRQLCLTLGDPMDCSLSGSSVHGIFQARGLEWGAIMAFYFLFSSVPQSCPTLNDPMDCSPPGSSVHGIFQARVLEWAVIAFSVIHTAVPQKPTEHCKAILLHLKQNRSTPSSSLHSHKLTHICSP